jgi:hypothetical protein
MAHTSDGENPVADAQRSYMFRVTSDSWRGGSSVTLQLGCAVAVQSVARVVTQGVWILEWCLWLYFVDLECFAMMK